ncbi:MAG: hypothetical protein KKA19_03525 [Candidatus Margulisbacteria bacterium]|nr:hypothetical protein [Candidatus Margulisiibacteriota bacterium]
MFNKVINCQYIPDPFKKISDTELIELIHKAFHDESLKEFNYDLLINDFGQYKVDQTIQSSADLFIYPITFKIDEEILQHKIILSTNFPGESIKMYLAQKTFFIFNHRDKLQNCDHFTQVFKNDIINLIKYFPLENFSQILEDLSNNAEIIKVNIDNDLSLIFLASQKDLAEMIYLRVLNNENFFNILNYIFTYNRIHEINQQGEKEITDILKKWSCQSMNIGQSLLANQEINEYFKLSIHSEHNIKEKQLWLNTLNLIIALGRTINDYEILQRKINSAQNIVRIDIEKNIQKKLLADIMLYAIKCSPLGITEEYIKKMYLLLKKYDYHLDKIDTETIKEVLLKFLDVDENTNYLQDANFEHRNFGDVAFLKNNDGLHILYLDKGHFLRAYAHIYDYSRWFNFWKLKTSPIFNCEADLTNRIYNILKTKHKFNYKKAYQELITPEITPQHKKSISDSEEIIKNIISPVEIHIDQSSGINLLKLIDKNASFIDFMYRNYPLFGILLKIFKFFAFDLWKAIGKAFKDAFTPTPEYQIDPYYLPKKENDSRTTTASKKTGKISSSKFNIRWATFNASEAKEAETILEIFFKRGFILRHNLPSERFLYDRYKKYIIPLWQNDVIKSIPDKDALEKGEYPELFYLNTKKLFTEYNDKIEYLSNVQRECTYPTVDSANILGRKALIIALKKKLGLNNH